MKIIWLPILSIVALTACDVVASPSTPAGTVINPTAGLGTFPGSSNTDVIPEGDDTRTYFEADAPITEVYAHFHSELGAQGWERTELEQGDDEIEAEYNREGRELEFELERDDGRYELEIDIDGDNASYDQDDQNDDQDDNQDDN